MSTLFFKLLNKLLGRFSTRPRSQHVRMLLQDGGECLAFSYATRGKSDPRHKAAVENQHRRIHPRPQLPPITPEDHL